MDRRSFLAGVAAVAAGCSGTGGDGESTPTATRAASSPTFTTETDPSTPSPRGTDAVGAAIDRARGELAGALQAIEAAEVVEGGTPGILSEDGSPGYSEELSAAEERTVAARERLEAVSDDATGEHNRAVERLLRLSLYLRAKRFTHRSLLNAFLDYRSGRQNLTRRPERAGETLQRGQRRFEQANRYRQQALDRLDALGEVEGTVAADGFDTGTERRELRTVERIVRQFRPSCRGFAAFTRLFRAARRATRAYEQAADPGTAAAEFRLVATHATEAERAFRTALDRDIPVVAAHRELLCLLERYREGAETAATAMEEIETGDTEAGRKLYERARRTYRTAESECTAEGGTPTGTSS
jgi:hypothetical protein